MTIATLSCLTNPVVLVSRLLPVAAAGLLLPVYIVSDIFALSAYRRDFNKEVLKIGIIGMSFGVIIGGMTAHIVVEWMVTALIGMMGFIFAINQGDRFYKASI